jgi:hypothetical protein
VRERNENVTDATDGLTDSFYNESSLVIAPLPRLSLFLVSRRHRNAEINEQSEIGSKFVDGFNQSSMRNSSMKWFECNKLHVFTALLFNINHTVLSFPANGGHTRRVSPQVMRAHSLNTAFEWLSEERYHNTAYKSIAWIDPSDPSQRFPCKDSEEESRVIMPLYPLGATYLPAHTNHTLNNVEPRNIRMAIDLLASEDRRFCAVLCASDTGRIASVGTVLRILEAEEQACDGKVVRIRLTCQAEDLVEICSIENPEASSRENRLLRSPEYLRARVRQLESSVGPETGFPEDQVSKLVKDFNLVRTMYQLEIGSHEMPPSALSRLGNALPSWSEKNFKSEREFWEAAQEWQSVCYTIRQGKQAMLSTDRNELMIAAASAKGGPLKLPIHMEDLSRTVQREVQLMEVDAQEDFCKLGLDPCLDFQALINVASPAERIIWLSFMISRERQRLETFASEPKPVNKEIKQEQKGAWFE